MDLKPFFVDRPVVPATKQREVRERRRTALSPMTDVVPVAKAHAAAREPATPVAMLERPA
jgi:hypothetical protein